MTIPEKIHQEIELKLQIATPEDIEAMKKFFSKYFSCQEAATCHMQARYFDTCDFLLLHSGLTYRIRLENTHYFATLKGKNQSNSPLCRRLEINIPATSFEPDANHFASFKDAQRFTHLAQGKKLSPIVTNDFIRQTMLVKHGNCQIEVSLDKGNIFAADKNIPICELELELKDGTEEDVLKLGTILKENFFLKDSYESKFYRGLHAIGIL